MSLCVTPLCSLYPIIIKRVRTPPVTEHDICLCDVLVLILFAYVLAKKKLYLYSIAEQSTKTTLCFSNYTECIQFNLPPLEQCPSGYSSNREVSTCGNTTEVFSYRFTLPCTNWHTCAQRIYSQTTGCVNQNQQLIRYIARECEEGKLK